MLNILTILDSLLAARTHLHCVRWWSKCQT